jgi:hypothetical protein
MTRSRRLQDRLLALRRDAALKGRRYDPSIFSVVYRNNCDNPHVEVAFALCPFGALPI